MSQLCTAERLYSYRDFQPVLLSENSLCSEHFPCFEERTSTCCLLLGRLFKRWDWDVVGLTHSAVCSVSFVYLTSSGRNSVTLISEEQQTKAWCVEPPHAVGTKSNTGKGFFCFQVRRDLTFISSMLSRVSGLTLALPYSDCAHVCGYPSPRSWCVMTRGCCSSPYVLFSRTCYCWVTCTFFSSAFLPPPPFRRLYVCGG